MSIHKKLVLTFITFSAVLIISMAILIKWSFQRGFVEYIRQQDSQTLLEITPDLTRFYAEQNGWGPIQNDTRRFYRLLRHFAMMRDDPDATGNPPPPGKVPFHLSVFLIDPTGKLIAGRDPKSQIIEQQAITVNGNVVGYFGLGERHRPPNRHDKRFADQQGKQLALITLLALLLSLLFAWPVAKFLVKRIQRLVSQVRHLSQGQYDHQIKVRGGDEFATLAQHLNDLANTLKKTEQSRRKLVADVSHELRTPLATLRAQLEAIEDGVHQYNDDTHARLHNQVMRLHNLVDDLYQLSLSDLGALQYRKQDCELDALILNAVQASLPAFDQAGIELTLDDELPDRSTVFADPQRITQLFSNLLQNSLQYTDTPGKTRVRCQREGNRYLVEFEDTAPSVSDSQLPQLFDRLYRAESSRNRDHGGAGLGLNLCKNIVQAHQGSIEIHNSRLGGIRVSVHLPVSN